jgi:hypothetical protein
MTEPTPPRYGSASLADATPSVLAALDVPGFANVLGVQPCSAAVILLVDALGWEALSLHAARAPFLAGLAEAATPISAGFPATTAASIGSVGTGLPPGGHGLVGYTFAVTGYDRPMNALSWALYGGGPYVDLRQEVVPEDFQPETTAFERAAANGVRVTLLGNPDHARSGMTRAVLRGGEYAGAYSMGDLAAEAAGAVRQARAAERRALVYAYHPNLDLTGHIRGVASDAYGLELAHVDRLASDIVDALPHDAALVVTGDHGMVDLSEDEKVDVADAPELVEAARMLAGEPRARFAYARPGAEADLLAAWRERLGDRMWVVERDEAISAGWFGLPVRDRVRPRIGDVVAAAHGRVGVFDRRVESFLASLVGHHGSMTPAEQLVPFLVHRT